MAKKYTAQVMRNIAQCLHYNSPTRLTIEAADMLRQAADMMERCENVLKANAKHLKCRHKDADAALAFANYILRGGGEEGAD